MHESWPEEASVTHFLGKPPRPTRITIGAVSFGVAALLNLVITGMYTTAGESAAGNWLLNPIDGLTSMPPLIFGLVTVVWLGLLGVFVWRGAGWALKPAKWTGLAGVVSCGLLGILAMPGISTVTKSEGLLTFYAILTLLNSAAYATAALALVGRNAADYFRVRPDGGPAAAVPQQVQHPQDNHFGQMEPPKFDPPPFEPPKFGDPR